MFRQLPNADYLLDVRDDSDPLHIIKGNPQLRPSDTYSVSARYGKFSRHTMADANMSLVRQSMP